MAQKKAHEAEIFLKNKPRSYPFILIYGSDRGLAAEYAQIFSQNCGVNLQDDFAVIKLDGDALEKDAARLIDEAQTIGFFAGKRLIWLNYSGAGSKSRLTEALKFLLESKLPDCYILIEAGDLKKGAVLRKIIEDSPQAMALPCYADEGAALQKLIDEVMAEFHCGISEEARLLLQNSLGADRRISRNELEKLGLYGQNSKNIDVEDVKNVLSDGRALNFNAVADAVLSGNIAEFNSEFDRSLAAGTQAFLMLAAVMRQMQQLQNFRFQIEQEGKTSALALATARPPIFFKRKKLMERILSLWNGAKIARAMERLDKTLLDSRKNSALGAALIRQNLLALTVEAARSRGV